MIFKKEKKKSIEELFKDKCNDVIENKKFNSQIELNNINFTKTMFKNCKFDKVTFDASCFDDTIFINCTFFWCNFVSCYSNFDSHVVFDKCFIHLSNFKKCSLSRAWICDSIIKGVSIVDTAIDNALFHMNCYYSLSFVDNCDLSSTGFIRSSGWLDISFKNENSSIKMNSKTTIKIFDYKDLHHTVGSKEVYTFNSTKEKDVANTFMNFANQFLKNDLSNNYGECFYDSKIALHKSLKWYKKFGSRFLKLTCGYGEKWTNGIVLSLCYIVFNAIIYMMNGLQSSYNKVINYDIIFNFKSNMFDYSKLKDFGECLYFSMMTFTTVGYGSSEAIGFISRLFSFWEMYLGIIITALITGTILRKLFR